MNGKSDNIESTDNKFTPAKNIALLNSKNIEQQLELYKLVLDNIYNGVVVVDANGYIIYFNKPYGQFLTGCCLKTSFGVF
jgi:transcriptional regulator with PAS, ATPase and Fis domain